MAMKFPGMKVNH